MNGQIISNVGFRMASDGYNCIIAIGNAGLCTAMQIRHIMDTEKDPCKNVDFIGINIGEESGADYGIFTECFSELSETEMILAISSICAGACESGACNSRRINIFVISAPDEYSLFAVRFGLSAGRYFETEDIYLTSYLLFREPSGDQYGSLLYEARVFAALNKLEFEICEHVDAEGRLNTEGVRSGTFVGNVYFNQYLADGDAEAAVNSIARGIVFSMLCEPLGLNPEKQTRYALRATEKMLSVRNVSIYGAIKENMYPEDSHRYSVFGYGRIGTAENLVLSYVKGEMYKKVCCPELNYYMDIWERNDLIRELFDHAYDCVINTELRGHAFGEKEDGRRKQPSVLWRMISKKMAEVCCPDKAFFLNIFKIIEEEGMDSWKFDAAIGEAAKAAAGKMDAYLEDLSSDIMNGIGILIRRYGFGVIESIYEVWKDPDISDGFGLKVQIGDLCGRMQSRSEKKISYRERPVQKVDILRVREDRRRWIKDTRCSVYRDIYCRTAGFLMQKEASGIRRFMKRLSEYCTIGIRLAAEIRTSGIKYIDQGQCFTEIKSFAGTSNNGGYYNLCSDIDSYSWLRSNVDSWLCGLNVDEMRKIFISKACSILLRADDGSDPAEFMNILESEVLRIGKIENLKIGLGDYMNWIISKGIDENEKARTFMNSIFEKLYIMTSPRILMNEPPVPDNVSDIVMIIPEKMTEGANGAYIIQSALEYAEKKGIRLFVRPDTDELECYAVYAGIALCRFRSLDDLETAYDKVKLMETSASGIPYPSVNLHAHTEGKDTVNSGKEYDFRKNVFDPVIRKAEDLKLIECDEADFRFRYYINYIPDDWNNLDISQYNLVEDGKCVRGKRFFEYLRTMNPSSKQDCRMEVQLKGSPFFERGFDLTEIADALHWQREFARKIAEGYMKRVLRKNVGLFSVLKYSLDKMSTGAVWDILTQKDRGIQAAGFLRAILNKEITVDNAGYRWTYVKHSGELIVFSRKVKASMDDYEKFLVDHGCELGIVYLRYLQRVGEEQGLTDIADMGEDQDSKNDVIKILSLFAANYSRVLDEERLLTEAATPKVPEDRSNDIRILYEETERLLDEFG